MIIEVGKNREWKSITSALKSLDPKSSIPVTLVLDPETYREKVTVLRSGITFQGAGADKTVISWGDGAETPDNEGNRLGTFNSYTLYIGGTEFLAENLTVENTAGPGHLAGQAVAVYADADQIRFRNCVLSGHQDTLCTGPLPIDPPPVMPPPKLPFKRIDNSVQPFHQFYEKCHIAGDIDFIFGSARALFRECVIESLERESSEPTYITAASHAEAETKGYQFVDCELIGKASPGSVFLGRPWRKFGRVSFENCRMGVHIHPAGWHNWDSKEKEEACRFREWGSSGPGAGSKASRVKWAERDD